MLFFLLKGFGMDMFYFILLPKKTKQKKKAVDYLPFLDIYISI